MSDKDSMLDSFMKGLGRQLGKRRRDVHQAIDRFNEEANKDEVATSVPDAGSDVQPELNDQAVADANSPNARQDKETSDEAKM